MRKVVVLIKEIKKYKIALLYDHDNKVYVCHDYIDVAENDYKELKDYYKIQYSYINEKDYSSTSLEKAEKEMKKRIKVSLSNYFKEEGNKTFIN